ncbi:hypothetical protein [uncultured Duncaniella sp.]|uniref:hypothetical protein n=1 Tax=uncultured Duncaniella sp. TaxID=2768039 RepID=UPI0025A98C82|nr:hypothetical protein [uncultured Duncaniella sp.]
MNNKAQEIRILNDSIQSLVDAYYSMEDIIAYAYINSDLNYSVNSDNIMYDDKIQVIEDRSRLLDYERFIFIPKSVCSSCVINLCDKLKFKNMLDKSAFLLPYGDEYDYYKSLIKEYDIPSSNIIYIDGDIGLPIEKEYVLFMFTLSQKYQFNNIYVPDKKLDNLTDIYLDVTNLKSNGLNNIKHHK